MTNLVFLRFSLSLFFGFLNLTFIFSQTGFIEGTPRIAFWEYGKSKETIIVLHGGPGMEHSYLQPEWDTLSTKFRIVYYDQRGSGKSDSSDNYSWIEHLKDLKTKKKSMKLHSPISGKT
jgi:pimeloyl-ACP methyl ester carboxylesterase